MPVAQLNSDGSLAHLLTLDGLPAAAVHDLFTLADFYAAGSDSRPLRGRLLVNIFFESSTRTRTAFEAAAKQLGADVVNLDQIRMAGTTKSESLQDTVRTVCAMGTAGIVLRHGEDGAAQQAADAADGQAVVINGGDGCHAHPTQGLADAYTLLRHFGDALPTLAVAIIGDVLRSRVARSDLHILRTLGVRDIRLAGPPQLCPSALAGSLGAPVLHDIDEALAGADVAILLRIQNERLAALRDEFALSPADYLTRYGLTEARQARMKPAAVIMHPGPINRGVEIADRVADSRQSLILQQVRNGMAIRKAVLTELIADADEQRR